MLDRLGLRCRFEWLHAATVHRAGHHPRHVVTYGPLGHAHQTRHRCVGRPTRHQRLDRHARLPIQPGHPPLRPIRNGETTYPNATLVNLAVALGPSITVALQLLPLHALRPLPWPGP